MCVLPAPEGQVDGFQVWVLMNEATANIREISMPTSSYDETIFNFDQRSKNKSYWTICLGGCSASHPNQQRVSVVVAPCPAASSVISVRAVATLLGTEWYLLAV